MSDAELTPPPAGTPAEQQEQPQPQSPVEDDAGFWDALRTALQEAAQIIAPALVLALIVHLFLAQATIVFGQSMEPNLHQNERLIVDKLSYRVRAPERGDIVVVDLPDMEEMLVKRIVALPGEQVEIQRGVVYVNGAPISEPFAHDMIEYDTPRLTLGPLSYFVLGDNRGNSNDSRSFGPVTRDQILGRVWLRYWPLDHATLF
ncbi:MAG: signal peptidase I [Caldilineaceae bacterium]|nr:signal peptidase I [Caldilineaceae bacterium]